MNLEWAFCHSIVGEMPQVPALYQAVLAQQYGTSTAATELQFLISALRETVVCENPHNSNDVAGEIPSITGLECTRSTSFRNQTGRVLAHATGLAKFPLNSLLVRRLTVDSSSLPATRIILCHFSQFAMIPPNGVERAFSKREGEDMAVDFRTSPTKRGAPLLPSRPAWFS